MNNVNSPDVDDYAILWLQTHFVNKNVVVLFDVQDNDDRKLFLKRWMSNTERKNYVKHNKDSMSQNYFMQFHDLELAKKACVEYRGDSIVWDGTRIVFDNMS